MTKEAIISNTLRALATLPAEKAEEVANFASFVLKKYEDDLIRHSIQKMAENSSVYKFLEGEENLYTYSDIKEKY